jgi:hypothetical protein
VSHGMVYSDLLQNPLIVPVKKLRQAQVFQPLIDKLLLVLFKLSKKPCFVYVKY